MLQCQNFKFLPAENTRWVLCPRPWLHPLRSSLLNVHGLKGPSPCYLKSKKNSQNGLRFFAEKYRKVWASRGSADPPGLQDLQMEFCRGNDDLEASCCGCEFWVQKVKGQGSKLVGVVCVL